MTSLMCWIGCDSRPVPSSAYIATDSRISWSSQTWDYGRKTYASTRTADIFGYCGFIVFPSLILSQFVSALDEGLYDGDVKSRHDGLERLARTSFDRLPQSEKRNFTIVHCGRDGEGLASRFRAYVLSWRGKWSSQELTLPVGESAVVHVAGSGKTAVEDAIRASVEGPKDRTTRTMFQSLVSALASGRDPSSGGAPQLAGLYRVKGGVSFGVLHQGERFLYGMPVHDLASSSGLEWRNGLFERTDGWNKKRLAGAQKH